MVELYWVTFKKISELFLFMCIGYILSRMKKIPKDAPSVLSKLLALVFCPALIINNLSENLTVDVLKKDGKMIAISTILVIALGFIAAFLSKKISGKDSDLRCTLNYNFAVSNYGYIGYPLISAVFGEIALCHFMLFVIPISLFAYTYGRMTLENTKLSPRFLMNPLTISIPIGILIGLLRIQLPSIISNSLNSLGNCMGPVSMILTGIVISHCPLKACFTNQKYYLISIIRLIALPVIIGGVLYLIGLRGETLLFSGCFLCMPFGTNPIIFRESNGLNSDQAASLNLLCNSIGLFTVPLLFSLFQLIM